jgi:Mrp family chromosome partitioning ATPase
MSRNYQLLERLAKEELLTPGGVPDILRVPKPFPPLKGSAKEELAKLIQRLFFSGGRVSGPGVISFSGIARDDRSCWICARAAELLALQADISVCLVDANFKSPQLHPHYDVSNRTGMASALGSDSPIRSFTTQLPVKNLWLLPSGPAKQGFELNVERCQARFAELRREFDYVFINAPSLAHEREATLMGQMGDGIVLIVEANQTGRKSLGQAKEHLQNGGVKILGAVLDQRRFPIPAFLYRKL